VRAQRVRLPLGDSTPKAGQRSAIIYTIIEECRLHGVDPFAYLADVMPRIMDHSSHRIAELLPRQWARSHGQG
jgi:hypothetical protein